MTAEEVLEIPGNRRVFEDLKKLLEEGNPIAFVGAGASAGLYPLWPQLIEMLVDHAVSEDRPLPMHQQRWINSNTLTPQQKASRVVRELGEGRYRQFLKKTFKPRPERFTEAQGALLRLPFKGYVTTN